MKYYIASCGYTKQFPEMSKTIREYVKANYKDIQILRCCVPSWKIKIYEDAMPEGVFRDEWKSIEHSRRFEPGDEVWSLCHNCLNLAEEMYPGIKVHSFWELVDSDENFKLPDCSGDFGLVTLQDCWRSRDRAEEQKAVRSLMTKMHIDYVEAQKNHVDTDFCGSSLYRPQVDRNPKLAPKHYAENIEGLFLPHTEEEQKQIMQEYCSHFNTDTVICYCHYCLEGLMAGGVNGIHIAQLLFG